MKLLPMPVIMGFNLTNMRKTIENRIAFLENENKQLTNAHLILINHSIIAELKKLINL